MFLISQLADPAALDAALKAVLLNRKHFPPNADIWHLALHWPRERARLSEELLAGTYRPGPTRRFFKQGRSIELWEGRDAVVWKAAATVLQANSDPHVFGDAIHLAGRGGAKAAVREALKQATCHPFVFQSDVKSYYASIRHEHLDDQLRRAIPDPDMVKLLWRSYRRVRYQDGHYKEITKGIPLGSALSPLFAALHLRDMDRAMDEQDGFYLRFMDDWVFFAPTRHKLRAAIRTAKQSLETLDLECHPDKTFAGRTDRGFDFLGYHIDDSGQTGVSRKSIERFAERTIQRYAQDGTNGSAGDYARRWLRWADNGLEVRRVPASAVPAPIACRP